MVDERNKLEEEHQEPEIMQGIEDDAGKIELEKIKEEIKEKVLNNLKKSTESEEGFGLHDFIYIVKSNKDISSEKEYEILIEALDELVEEGQLEYETEHREPIRVPITDEAQQEAKKLWNKVLICIVQNGKIKLEDIDEKNIIQYFEQLPEQDSKRADRTVGYYGLMKYLQIDSIPIMNAIRELLIKEKIINEYGTMYSSLSRYVGKVTRNDVTNNTSEPTIIFTPDEYKGKFYDLYKDNRKSKKVIIKIGSTVICDEESFGKNFMSKKEYKNAATLNVLYNCDKEKGQLLLSDNKDIIDLKRNIHEETANLLDCCLKNGVPIDFIAIYAMKDKSFSMEEYLLASLRAYYEMNNKQNKEIKEMIKYYENYNVQNNVQVQYNMDELPQIPRHAFLPNFLYRIFAKYVLTGKEKECIAKLANASVRNGTGISYGQYNLELSSKEVQRLNQKGRSHLIPNPNEMKTTDFNNPYDFVRSNETMPDYSAANIYNETWNSVKPSYKITEAERKEINERSRKIASYLTAENHESKTAEILRGLSGEER